MTTLSCITNIMDDARGCRVVGEHEARCDGWEYRWDAEVGAEVATGRECRGCLPRPAEHGLLCGPCWRSLERAIAAYGPLAEMLRTVERFVQQSGGGGSTEPTVPLPPTLLALDEIESYWRSARASTVEVWVASEEGAIDAVRFTRAVRGALSAFPTVEKSTVIPRTRCPECHLLVLQWTPPELPGDPVRIVCRNPACGYELNQERLEVMRFTHLVEHPEGSMGRSWLRDAAAQRLRVTALCGYEWTPEAKATPYPPCPDCETIANKRLRGEA